MYSFFRLLSMDYKSHPSSNFSCWTVINLTRKIPVSWLEQRKINQKLLLCQEIICSKILLQKGRLVPSKHLNWIVFQKINNLQYLLFPYSDKIGAKIEIILKWIFGNVHSLTWAPTGSYKNSSWAAALKKRAWCLSSNSWADRRDTFHNLGGTFRNCQLGIHKKLQNPYKRERKFIL